jgi:hypothetical protein
MIKACDFARTQKKPNISEIAREFGVPRRALHVDNAITQKTQPKPKLGLGWVWVRIFDPTLGFGYDSQPKSNAGVPKNTQKNPKVGAIDAKWSKIVTA